MIFKANVDRKPQHESIIFAANIFLIQKRLSSSILRFYGTGKFKKKFRLSTVKSMDISNLNTL